MRRVAVAGATALAAAVVGVASTSSNSLPSSTANYTSVGVTGASMRGVSYTVTNSTITGFTMQVGGSQVLKTATASFNGGTALPCVIGLYDASAGQTSLTCTGFTQRADRSWRLNVTFS